MTTPASEGLPLNPTPTFSLPRPELPAEPLVVVEATQSWEALNFSELWAHRELFYFLVWRDLKVRYKQTIIGFLWVVLQPILITVVFSIFLGFLVRVPSGGIPYPLMVFSGMLPWTFFASSLTGAASSLIGNSALITKVYFPRVLVPAANILGRLVDFSISFLILAVLILYFTFGRDYPFQITKNMLALPVIFLLLVLLTLASGILVSCLNVKYRDIGLALPVLIQLWMFVSPVVYSESLVPGKWRAIYSLNPLASIIKGFRASLFGMEMPWMGLATASAFTIGLLIVAALAFRHTEKTFADLV
jgi:homopolymeric O-antigen transport system permease protein